MPTILSFKQAPGGKTQGVNGLFTYRVYWRVNPAPAADGLIIQKVTIDYRIYQCDGSAQGTPIANITARNNAIGYDTYPTYWELWTVAAGKTYPTYNTAVTAVQHNPAQAAPKRWDDDYGMDQALHGTNTRGWVRYLGEAGFYLVSTVPNWATLFTADANSPAAMLPISTVDPVLPAADSNVVHHNVATYWDNCLADTRRHVTRVQPFASPGLWPDLRMQQELDALAVPPPSRKRAASAPPPPPDPGTPPPAFKKRRI